MLRDGQSVRRSLAFVKLGQLLLQENDLLLDCVQVLTLQKALKAFIQGCHCLASLLHAFGRASPEPLELFLEGFLAYP